MIGIAICYLCQALIYYYCLALGMLVVRRVISPARGSKSEQLKRKTLMVVFGSGGHTSEMLMMLSKQNQFDFSKYKQVQFVIGHSDTWSLTKIKDFFSRGSSKPFDIERDVSNLRIERLFRSREVKQSYLTSVLTTILALFHSFWIVLKCRPDIIVTNGPGTAVPLCYAHFGLSKLLLWNINSKILFIESFCRVTSLSLSGKLLKPIASKFIVHWDELKKRHPSTLLYKDKII